MSYSVLLVDDNKVFADSFAEQLNTQGVLVDVCYGYQDALVLLNAHEYNVCVFDILLQDGSGLELTRYIMDMHLPTEVILIIFILSESILSFLPLGLNFFISTPFGM